MKSRSAKEIISVNSVYGMAKNFLEILHKNADKMKAKMDLHYDPWLSGEYEEKYDAAHKVILKFTDSGLTRTHFYAASELIQRSCASLKDQVEEKIKLECNQGSEQLVIHCDHSQIVRNQNELGITKLPAPIALVPFAAIKNRLDKTAEVLTSAIWDQPASTVGLITQEFKDEKTKKLFLESLKAIEACCKELESGFDLNIHSPFTFRGPFLISISKAQLAKARVLFFKDVVCAAKEDLASPISMDTSSDESKATPRSSTATISALFGKLPVVSVAVAIPIASTKSGPADRNVSLMIFEKRIDKTMRDFVVAPKGAPGGPSFS